MDKWSYPELEISKRSLFIITWDGVGVNLQQKRAISNLVSARSGRLRSSCGQDIAKDWDLEQASDSSEKWPVGQRRWSGLCAGWGGSGRGGGRHSPPPAAEDLPSQTTQRTWAERSVHSPQPTGC